MQESAPKWPTNANGISSSTLPSTKRAQQRLRGNAGRRFLEKRHFCRAADSPHGMPISIRHAHALMVLHGRGELSQQELGGDLCIDKSNVARRCANMLAAGHARTPGRLIANMSTSARVISARAGSAWRRRRCGAA
jgi:hypothetical protein